MTAESRPVADRAADHDFFDAGHVRDPEPVREVRRGRRPIARTERHGGSWLPTRYDDMLAPANMVPPSPHAR